MGEWWVKVVEGVLNNNKERDSGNKMRNNNKSKISISIDRELLAYIDQLVEKIEYRSRSHVFEIAISRLRDSE